MKITMGHASLQTQDTIVQRKADLEKIIKRAASRYQWMTGTESLDAATRRVIIRLAKKYGFTFHCPRGQDSWILVRKSIIKAGTKVTRYYSGKIIDGVAGAWPNQGVVAIQFFHKDVKRWITVIACHFQTRGWPMGPRWRRIRFRQNVKLATAISRYAKKMGVGSRLVFAGVDHNIPDNIADVWLGGPFTTVADEVGKHPSTSESGPIDSISTYDADLAVKALDWRVYNDRPFFLYGDHYLCEADVDIKAA